MSYPLINGAAINADEQVKSKSLRPVRFGLPTLQMRVAGLHPAQFGFLSLEMRAASLRMGGFGKPSAVILNSVSALAPVQWGIARLAMNQRAESMRAGSFGVPRLKTGTDLTLPVGGMHPAQFGEMRMIPGLPPSGITRPVRSSLRPQHFGTPTLCAVLTTGAAASLRPAGFGLPTLCTVHSADSLRPAQWGIPGLALGSRAATLRPVMCGKPRLSQALRTSSLRTTHLGVATLQLGALHLQSQSLRPVQFGMPAYGGVALHLRPLCPVRMGRPALDRGAIC